MGREHKPNLLAIVPPYTTWIPPLGAAKLMGHLKAAGCHDFDFIDFRLWTSDAYAPTYDPVGTYGETFVVDVPDLPLVLKTIDAFDHGRPVDWEADSILERYALDRGIHFEYLSRYLTHMDRFLSASIAGLGPLEFVGLSTWSSNFLTTLMAACHLKRRRDAPFIVLGGPAVSLSRNSALLALRSGLADAVVIGEGEQALLSLFEAFQATSPLRNVPGVLTLDAPGGQASYTERPLMRMAEQALPDFSCMPVLSYQTHGYPLTILPFEISRGCTDKCSFCSEWVLWRRYRDSSAELIVDQLGELVRRYGAQGIWFRDSLMNGVQGRFIAFCEMLLAKGPSIKWMGYARADFDEATAKLARKAGMESTYVGVESMDDRTLELMNKRRTGDDNMRALRALLNAGVRVRAGFIPGFPGTTREAVRRTAGCLGRLQREFRGRLTVNSEAFTPYAGQPILNSLAEYGLEPHKWSEEVLDIAGDYRDITERIIEKVSGASQGLERLGMQREVSVIAGAGEGRAGENADVFVTRATTEDIHDQRLLFEDIGEGLWLARYKSEDGVRQCLMYTDREKRDYARAMLFDMDGDTVRKHTAKILARHLAPATNGIGETHRLPVPLGPAAGDAAHLTLSPFAVARVLGEEILIIDRFSKLRVRIGLALWPGMRALIESGEPDFGGVAAAADTGEAQALIEEMRTKGLILATALTKARTAAAEMAGTLRVLPN